MLYTTDDVFGVTRDLPLNYVERHLVDNKFIDDLSVKKHIVVYGSSKQGKTSLRRNCLNENEYVLVQCQNTWEIEKLAEAILKAVGFRVETSTMRTVDGKAKISIEFGFSGIGKAGGKVQGGVSNTTESRPLDLDPSDPNDLVAALEACGFSKLIVLEDFHYLPKEVQESFSFFLKTVHERSGICFIIVAVWREENRLILFNGDLSGRVVAVDADAWSAEELKKVIEKGENLLNIRFLDQFKAELIEGSLGSVYIVQESARLACRDCEVAGTEDQTATLHVPHPASVYIQRVVRESAPRYKSFLSSFAGGFQTTTLEMYRWLLYPILTSSVNELERGLTYRFIRETLQKVHPRGEELNPGNVTQALVSVPALQVKKNIKPFVLDYDQSDLRLSIVDKGFLIWLNSVDVNEVLESIELPVRGQQSGCTD